ncbi:CD209 antigen-like protein B [Babylonia areolata]|uniref:CD209 antigen-like protein B n=1 Tax=Babylonia areolata TaxID=304850 RepID=UPI003FCF60F5
MTITATEETVCEELGGMLVEVGGVQEHTYIQGMLRDNGVEDTPTWIGLQDFAEEGEFVWTRSKTRAHPTFWNSKENSGDPAPEEDCAAYRNGGWIDANCELHRYHFICETM